jgi:hypothetical protein
VRANAIKAAACTLGASIAVTALWVASASGERAQSGNVIATLRSEMKPHFRPRSRAVPVSLSLGSDFSTDDGRPLPELRRITLEVGGHGKLGHHGLPVCREARIRDRTQRRALAECGSALVGKGHLDGEIHIEGQEPFPFRGRMLMFNGRLNGRPVTFADVHSSSPPVSFVMPFVPRRGEVGTRLSAELPQIADGFLRIDHFDLTLNRRFKHRGETRGYINASCAVPEGFTALVFPVVEATYDFVGGRSVSIVAWRGCSVSN